jgi:hypothetical protein
VVEPASAGKKRKAGKQAPVVGLCTLN